MTVNHPEGAIADLCARMRAFIDDEVIPAEPVLAKEDAAAHELLGQLRSRAKELGLWALGYPADGLYYHLALLERFGLVIRSKPDKQTGAARFDLPGRPMTLQYRLPDRQHARATTEVVATMLRSASRGFRRAYAPGLATVEGPRRNLRAGRRTAWLTPDDLRALNYHIERIHQLFGRGRPRRSGARLHEFTYVLAPCLPAGRRLTARHHPSP